MATVTPRRQELDLVARRDRVERLFLGAVLADLDDLSVANLPDVSLGEGDLLLCTADPAAQHERDNHVIASIDELLDVGTEVIERVNPLLDQRRNAVVAAMHVAIGKVGGCAN